MTKPWAFTPAPEAYLFKSGLSRSLLRRYFPDWLAWFHNRIRRPRRQGKNLGGPLLPSFGDTLRLAYRIHGHAQP